MGSPAEVVNFGSLNLDQVFRVPHLVRPGETLAAGGCRTYPGGKGLNQSIALARAGVRTIHAGKIGPDGALLEQTLREAGVDTSLLSRDGSASGRAVIQVDDSRQNAILLFPGANREITSAEIGRVIETMGPQTMMLVQNEINLVPEIIRRAKHSGHLVICNPAPCTPEVATEFPLEDIDLLVVNEVEGADLSGELEPEDILYALTGRFPKMEIVLTLGSKGAIHARGSERIVSPAPRATVVDTTAAGDTFIGYFLASRLRGFPAAEALRHAGIAAGIAIGRPGAAPSIPMAFEVFDPPAHY